MVVLSEDKRSLVKVTHTEALRVCKQNAPCHLQDMHGYIPVPSETRARVDDVPFEGFSVFSATTVGLL